MCDCYAQWHFNVGLKTAAQFHSWDYSKVFKHEISGLYVIAQFKLSLRHQLNYIRLNACDNSSYKLKDLTPEFRKEIKKAIIENTLIYEVTKQRII